MSERYKKLNPTFPDLDKTNGSSLNNPQELKQGILEIISKEDPTSHDEILIQLLEQFEPLDFYLLAFPEIEHLRAQLETIDQESDQANDIRKKLDKKKLNSKHYLVLSIENVRTVAEKNRWGLCKNQEFIYLFNGAYWTYIDREAFQKFLGQASEKMGVPKFMARYYLFREQLLKQFIASEYLPTPAPSKAAVNINLRNGTFEVTPTGTNLRSFDRSDFITYQLPFNYNPEATAPIFKAYLDKVLPDEESRKILAEYMGFVFIKHGSKALKEEKALILFGTGANGKSVFFEVVNALLGVKNVSTYTLQSLTDPNGYYRAMIANKLVNYASEINGKLETSHFKQLVSGEPVEARLPYGRPMQITQYAKLIFNCNELPKDVEHTAAYFRRFLIIPFDVTIPEHEQDKSLHNKIIENELSGVFNWVLEGLNRLLTQKRFSPCDVAKQAVDQYKTESDSVKYFIEEMGYANSSSEHQIIKEFYLDYRGFCMEEGLIPVKKTNFIRRLKGCGVVVERKNIGYLAYMSKVPIQI